MGQVEDDQTLIVGVLACEAHAIAAARCDAATIDTNVYGVRGTDQAATLSCALVDVVDWHMRC